MKHSYPLEFVCHPKDTNEMRESIEQYQRRLLGTLEKHSTTLNLSDDGRKLDRICRQLSHDISEGIVFLPEYKDRTTKMLEEYYLLLDIVQRKTINSLEGEDNSTRRNDELFDLMRTDQELINLELTLNSVRLWHERTSAWKNHYSLSRN